MSNNNDALEMLVAMGFDAPTAKEALRVTAGNVEQAANYLLTGEGGDGRAFETQPGNSSASGTSSVIITQGTKSQYSVANGKSACTCMALFAAQALLQSSDAAVDVDAAFLDEMVIRGSEIYTQWITTQNTGVEHTSPEDILKAGLFPNLACHDIRQGMLTARSSSDDQHPLGLSQQLSAIQNDSSLSSAAVAAWTCIVMTKTPETVLLCLPPKHNNSNNKYLLIDSHPRSDAQQAHVKQHDSLQALVSSIEAVFPAIELGADVPELMAAMYNSFDLYPLTLVQQQESKK